MKNFLFLSALMWSSFSFGQQNSSQTIQQTEPKKLTQKSVAPKKRSTKKTVVVDKEVKNFKRSPEDAKKN